MNFSSLNIGMDANIYKLGANQNLYWNYARNPHLAVFGSSGSGKTHFSKLLLGRIGLIEDSEIILCDYKGDTDFEFADKSSNCYRFNDCDMGLNHAVEMLRKRQENIDKHRHPVFFFFDEWISYVNQCEGQKSDGRRKSDIVKNSLSSMLCLSRSFNIFIIISGQRFDARFFDSARDNFSVMLGLGHLSKEMVAMSFNEYKDVINRSKSQGQGSVIIGNQFHNIIVPAISNQEKLHSTILTALNRYP